jgi:serine/threonine protein kinase
VLLDTEHHTALLGDFGIAKFSLVPPPSILTGDTEEGLATGTAIGTVIGTPEYMSPEQCSGGDIGYTTDVYSLACVVYEMLVGSPPFSGHPWEVLQMHLTSPPPPLRPVRAEVPPELESCILQALAKTPDGRFPTAGDFGRAVALSAGVTPRTGAWSYLTTPHR